MAYDLLGRLLKRLISRRQTKHKDAPPSAANGAPKKGAARFRVVGIHGGGQKEQPPHTRVDFRPPTYVSDTYPRLPLELFELILDYLRLDLPALMRCRLVCRAWYCTARLPPFLLTGESNLRFTRRNAFEEFARLIGVRGNRSYFRFSELALTLVDDPTHRFVHLWALQVPEYFLSGLRVLALAELNWTTTRPHARFLRRLSHCVTLVQLTLSGCRFRNASVPRNVINSLPSLEAIWLWDTRFDDLPTSLSLIPPTIAHQSLKYIRIRSTSGNDLADSFGSVHSQNLLSLCIQYQNITTLGLDLRYVSPSHLQRVLRHYHGLSELWLNNAFDPTLELEGGLPFDEADLGGQHTEQHLRTLSVFTLQDTSTVCALHILRLITPYISRNLYELTIELVDRPSAALLRSVTRVLELTGPGLTRMKWTNEKGNVLDAVPCTSSNTSLRRLMITLCLEPSPGSTQRCLTAVLANITSPHLRSLIISINFLQPPSPSSPGEDRPMTMTNDARHSRSAFHRVLAREVFDHFADNISSARSIIIHVSTRQIREDTVLVSAIHAHMVDLFAPWLRRGFLALDFEGRRDVSQYANQSFSSSFSKVYRRIRDIRH